MKLNNTQQKIENYTNAHKQKKKWLIAVIGVAVLVAFFTFYALILPAITMGKNQKLVCCYEIHQHNENCYDDKGNLICGIADYAVHIHNPEYCCDSEGNLICPLEQIEVHQHDDSCYDAGGVLICEKQEIMLHTHSEECYEDIFNDSGEIIGKKLVCGKLQVEEHQHDSKCMVSADKQPEENYNDDENLICPSEQLEANNIMIADVNTNNQATSDGGFAVYVKNIDVESIADGTENFDDKEGDGNDTGNNNRIVRTFDTIKYNVNSTFDSRYTQLEETKEATLCFEINMYKGLTEAAFDTSTMTWLSTGNSEWEIEYLSRDSGGNEYVSLIQTSDGKFYRKDNDGNFTIETSINEIVNGSNTENAYKMNTGAIVHQRLIGKLPLKKENSIVTGRQDFTTGIRVLNAENGDKFTPEFSVYFEDNKDNYGKINDGTSSKVTDNHIKLDESYKNGECMVTVSCAPLYNMILKGTNEYSQTNRTSYKRVTKAKKSKQRIKKAV